MNLQAIQGEMCRRLLTVVDTVYPTPPASPAFPSVALGFPTVTSFHVEYSRSVARMTMGVTMHAGRGDTDDAMDRLSTWLSTGNPLSVVDVLEAKDPDVERPWLRLTVIDTNGVDTSAESVSTTFNLEIDCA